MLVIAKGVAYEFKKKVEEYLATDGDDSQLVQGRNQ